MRRQFEDFDELLGEMSPEEIVTAVNRYFEFIEARRLNGLKYRTKQRLFEQAARRLLDPDEVERIEAEAVERTFDNAKIPNDD